MQRSLRSSWSFFVAAGLLTPLLWTGCKREDPAPSGPSAGAAASAEPVDLRTRANTALGVIEPVAGLDEANVALGIRLYHDPNLSADGTISCASCHAVSEGGGDGARVSTGIAGQLGPINSPTTLNSHLNFVQFWDGRAATLEEQAAGPIENPLEMGHTMDAVIAYLQSEPSYVAQFEAAAGGTINADTITSAIADYERTLTTPNSPFDRWLQGEDRALSDDAVAGLQLFFDAGCTACHMGPGLGGTMYQRMGLVQNYFELRGGEITEADLGRFNVTGAASDRHSFKVPLLRNVALTSPYFHDGAVESLAEAVAIMGRVQLNREFDETETSQLVAFLTSLTGDVPVVDLAALSLPAARTPTPDEAPAPDDDGAEVAQ